MDALFSTVNSLKTLTLLRVLTISVGLESVSWDWMDDITSSALQVSMLAKLVWILRSNGTLNLVKRHSFQILMRSWFPEETVELHW